jgi:hypothetical protein
VSGGTKSARAEPAKNIVTNPRPPVVAKPIQQRAATARGPKKAVVEKRAAERIQRTWLRERVAFLTRKTQRKEETKACTKLQARYRSYRVVKRKKRIAATTIQRRVRGFLVRLKKKRAKAATKMQAFGIGFIIRQRMKLRHYAATRLQTVARGRQGRKMVNGMKDDYEKASQVTQRAFRGHQGRQKAKKKRSLKMQQEAEQQSALAIQRIHRGKTERAEADKRRKMKKEHDVLESGATRIQAMFRRLVAYRRVISMKKDQQARRFRAANSIQALSKGFLARQIYLRRLNDLSAFPYQVVVIQRYARGWLVRKRMLEQARRAESELGAANLVQRMYRGYRGRLEWEAKYEETWSREIAALRLQRAFRGFRARRKIYGLRKKYIRAEFAVAKRVFRAAQVIQAAMRGRLSRGLTERTKANVSIAALTIQRIFRGHRVRLRLWEAVLDERATRIQSHTRGMLARMRLAQIGYHVRVIQRRGRAYIASKSADAAKAAS